jgi:ABC-2 type transport system ATP-binding protein
MWAFLQEINQQGTTIILTTHYLEEAESLCRNIAIIDQGQIVKNTSIRQLLKQLNKETFVLDVEQTVTDCPAIAGYPMIQVDDHSFEVSIEKSQSINALFDKLSAQGIQVLSMRNKSNRLEELFFDLVEKNLKGKDNNSSKETSHE